MDTTGRYKLKGLYTPLAPGTPLTSPSRAVREQYIDNAVSLIMRACVP
ncbi:MAG: hypothetical protein WBW93_10650 [Steroidobacteraceae bacterium]